MRNIKNINLRTILNTNLIGLVNDIDMSTPVKPLGLGIEGRCLYSL